MHALLIARFRGDVEELIRAYDQAHRAIMDAGGPPGELRHHCAVGDDWESEDAMRTRFASPQMRDALARAGFPAMDQAEITVLRLHAAEPPL